MLKTKNSKLMMFQFEFQVALERNTKLGVYLTFKDMGHMAGANGETKFAKPRGAVLRAGPQPELLLWLICVNLDGLLRQFDFQVLRLGSEPGAEAKFAGPLGPKLRSWPIVHTYQVRR